jgi:hypothetical protein
MGDEVEHVKPRDALGSQQLRRVGLVLLQRRGEHVTRVHLLASRALHVKHGRLQDPAEGEGLLRLFVLSARELFDRLFQILVEVAPQLRQVGPAGCENSLPVLIVRQRVEQVLQGQMRVPPRRRLAVRNRQNDFE